MLPLGRKCRILPQNSVFGFIMLYRLRIDQVFILEDENHILREFSNFIMGGCQSDLDVHP